MPLWLILLVASLATGRITRLIVTDDLPFLYYPREWIIARRPDHLMTPASMNGEGYCNHWYLGELVSCPWCASGWVAGAITLWLDIQVGLPLPVLCGFTIWMVGAAVAAQYK